MTLSARKPCPRQPDSKGEVSTWQPSPARPSAKCSASGDLFTVRFISYDFDMKLLITCMYSLLFSALRTYWLLSDTHYLNTIIDCLLTYLLFTVLELLTRVRAIQLLRPGLADLYDDSANWVYSLYPAIDNRSRLSRVSQNHTVSHIIPHIIRLLTGQGPTRRHAC